MEEFFCVIGAIFLLGFIIDGVEKIISYLKKKKNVKLLEEKYLEKEEYFKTTLLYMSIVLEPDKLRHLDIKCDLEKQSPESIQKYFIEEIELYRNLYYILSTSDITDSLEKFLKKSTIDTYKEVAKAMKNDLKEIENNIR